MAIHPRSFTLSVTSSTRSCHWLSQLLPIPYGKCRTRLDLRSPPSLFATAVDAPKLAAAAEEGRRMTRSARRALPDPPPEDRDGSEHSVASENGDVAAQRNADIEARIQRLQCVIDLP